MDAEGNRNSVYEPPQILRLAALGNARGAACNPLGSSGEMPCDSFGSDAYGYGSATGNYATSCENTGFSADNCNFGSEAA